METDFEEKGNRILDISEALARITAAHYSQLVDLGLGTDRAYDLAREFHRSTLVAVYSE